MFLHINHISDNGFSKLIIKSAHTDVEMLAIYLQNFIAALCCILGVQKIKPASFISKQFLCLGPERCKTLPGIHALTGCGSTSAFVGKSRQ